LERFDWRAVVARRKKRGTLDAIEQLIRYRDVIGGEVPISARSIQSGELFTAPVSPAE